MKILLSFIGLLASVALYAQTPPSSTTDGIFGGGSKQLIDEFPLGNGISWDKGDGNGKIANRAILKRCGVMIGWEDKGIAWVLVHIDESGKVTEANFQKTTKRGDVSNITSPAQIRLAEKCAKEYVYEPALGMGKSCGSIPIVFKRQ